MKLGELREKNIHELQELLLNSQKQLDELVFKKRAGKLEKFHEIQRNKIMIARILTILRERKTKI